MVDEIKRIIKTSEIMKYVCAFGESWNPTTYTTTGKTIVNGHKRIRMDDRS